MPTLITTPGAADANSYGTLAEAEAFFETRLFTDAWDALMDTQKEGLLIWATRIAESRVVEDWQDPNLPSDDTTRVLTDLISDDNCTIVWRGSPATETQALSWPRTGMVNTVGTPVADNEVPQRVKDWQFEIALTFAVADRTTENAATALGLVGLKAGPVDLKFSQAAPNPKLITGAVMRTLVRSWWYAFKLEENTNVKVYNL